MSRFIVLSQQRSGSHMLMSLLNSHSDIHCNSDSKTVDVKKNGKEWTYEVGFNSNSKVNGFLLKIKNDLYKDISSEDNVKIIYLKRENFLHVLLSKKMAKLFGCYEKESLGISLHNAREARESAASINIEEKEAEAFFHTWSRKHRAVKEYVEKNKLKYLEVKYRDLCSNTCEEMKHIYDFLEVNSLKPSFAEGRGAEKLDPRDVRSSILNYDQLKEYFKTTAYAKFFEE